MSSATSAALVALLATAGSFGGIGYLFIVLLGEDVEVPDVIVPPSPPAAPITAEVCAGYCAEHPHVAVCPEDSVGDVAGLRAEAELVVFEWAQASLSLRRGILGVIAAALLLVGALGVALGRRCAPRSKDLGQRTQEADAEEREVLATAARQLAEAKERLADLEKAKAELTKQASQQATVARRWATGLEKANADLVAQAAEAKERISSLEQTNANLESRLAEDLPITQVEPAPAPALARVSIPGVLGGIFAEVHEGLRRREGEEQAKDSDPAGAEFLQSLHQRESGDLERLAKLTGLDLDAMRRHPADKPEDWASEVLRGNYGQEPG